MIQDVQVRHLLGPFELWILCINKQKMVNITSFLPSTNSLTSYTIAAQPVNNIISKFSYELFLSWFHCFMFKQCQYHYLLVIVDLEISFWDQFGMYYTPVISYISSSYFDIIPLPNDSKFYIYFCLFLKAWASHIDNWISLVVILVIFG